jgi:hypothetical protein
MDAIRSRVRRYIAPNTLGVQCSALLTTLVLLVISMHATAAQTPMLTSILITSSANTDIVTVEFSGGAPTYQIVKRTDRLRADVSGAHAPKDRAPVQGSQVHVTPSDTPQGLVLSVAAISPVTLRVDRTPFRFTFSFQSQSAQPSSVHKAPAAGINEAETSELVFLKYAEANEVLGMLGAETGTAAEAAATTQLIAQNPPALVPFGSSTFQQQSGQALPTLQSASGSSGAQRVNEHLAINRRLNAVLLSGTPALIEALRKRIALFDVPVASITLEAKIVELTESAARNVGFSFPSGGAVGTGGLQIQSFQKPTFEISLQAQILAQIEKGGGRVIATPSIQALSGQSASILTGDAIPVVTTITFPGSPPTIQQQIQYINVGVQLQILPRYSSDGFVTSKISSQVSSVTAFLSGNIPQISQRVAVTEATVKDGESYVIGGLVEENEIKSVSKIPGLGDLPLLGGLFRSERSSHQKTSLYIVVTPHVRLPPALSP